MFRTIQTILARYGGENTLPPVLTNIRIDGVDESPLIVFCIMNTAKRIDRCVFASKKKHSIIGTAMISPMLGPDGVEGWEYNSSSFRALDNVWLRFVDNRTHEEFVETAAMYTEYLIETSCVTTSILAQLFLPKLADTAALSEAYGIPEDALISTADKMRASVLGSMRISLELPSPSSMERISMVPPRPLRRGVPEGDIGHIGAPEKEPRTEEPAAPDKKEVPPAGPAAMKNDKERKPELMGQEMKSQETGAWKIPETLPDVSSLPDVKAYITALKKYGTDAVCRFVEFVHTDFAKDCAEAFRLLVENMHVLPSGAKVVTAGSRREINDDGVSIYIVGDYVQYETQVFDAASLKRAPKYPRHYKALRLKSDMEEFEEMIRKFGADISDIPPAYFAQQTLIRHCANCDGREDDGKLHKEDLAWLSATPKPTNAPRPAEAPQKPAPVKQEPAKPVVKPEIKPAPAADKKPAPVEPRNAKPEAAKQASADNSAKLPKKPAPAPVREEPESIPFIQPAQKEPVVIDSPAEEPSGSGHTTFYNENIETIQYNSELADPVIKGLTEAVRIIGESDGAQTASLVEKYKGYIKERHISPTYVNDYLAVSANHRSKSYAAVYAAAQLAIKFEKEHKPLSYDMTCLSCGTAYKTDISTISADNPVVRCFCPKCGKEEEFTL